MGTTGFSLSRSAPLKKFLLDLFPEANDDILKIRMFDMVKHSWCKENTSWLRKILFFTRFTKARRKFNELFKNLTAKGFPYQLDNLDEETLASLSLSMKDFLKKHGLSFLYKGFNNRFVAYGYGNLDDIPAYYGILLMQHNYIVPNTYYFFKDGNDTLWKKAIEKYQIPVELGTTVLDINYSLWDLEKTVSLQIEQEGYTSWKTFDFVMLTTPHLFADKLPEEVSEAFEYSKSIQYAAKVVELEQRAYSSRYYTFEFPKKAVRSFNNELAVLINFGKIQEIASEKAPINQKLHVSLQLTQPLLNDKSTEKLSSEVNRNFARKNGVQRIYKEHLWKNYFPHISSEGIANGAMQTIHDAQGKHGLWYLGSSIAGELTTLVTEFNQYLLNREHPVANVKYKESSQLTT